MSDSDLELYSIVGRMLREIREHRDLSLEVVSDYLKIAPKSLQRYECGERKIKIGTIKELCNYYKIDYDAFIVKAKLRFGKDLYVSASSEGKKYPKILQYFEQLNDVGQHVATERVKELTEVPRYVREDSTYVNAAHANEGATKEEKQHDEEIMDFEYF